jgi:hypothetical protein
VCVFTDKKKKALALALVPIVAINVYAGCKMLNKTSKDVEVQQGAYIEGTIDKEIIPGETFLELDDNTIEVQEVDKEDLVEDSNGNLIMEQVVNETDFTRLERICNESGREFQDILCNEDMNSELYASALYKKLKLCNIPDDIIRRELDNIIIYGSNATCIDEDEWIRLFGNLDNTISIYDNVVDYYYPLAKYVHLNSCNLEHSSLFFDEFRITCSSIKELYDIYNPQIDIKDYFTEMISLSDNKNLINQFNVLVNSGIDLDILLCELENVYACAMVPMGLEEDEWLNLFSNLMKTVPETENVCMYYYDLAYYVHQLWCDFDHELNVFGRYTCDAYNLTLEI